MTDTADRFEPHLGSTFRTTEVDEVDLRLAEVRRLGHQPGAPREDPFALLFTGPPDVALPQQVHRLHHEALGDLQIFLVPIGPGSGTVPRYEAVFN